MMVINGRDLTYREIKDIIKCYNDGFNAEYINRPDFLYISRYNVFSIIKYGEYEDVVATAMAIIKPSLIHGLKSSMRIENVAVRKEFRGNGFGGEVVKELISLAKENSGKYFPTPCYKIDLSCSEKNLGFYEKLGFKQHEYTMRIDCE